MAGMPAGGDLLEAIVAATRRVVQSRRARRSTSDLERAAAAVEPRGAAFAAALAARGGLNVIAECKRRSPSRGVLREDYDPVAIARRYAAAGAAAISVLTEPTFFDGSLEHLQAVRAAVSLPLLRKDFIVDPYQLIEARAARADAVLLIVSALSRDTLRSLVQAAAALELATLIEVHDEREVDVALETGAVLIGVNNRNLRTLEVSLDASARLVERIPADRVAVAESGLRTHGDLVRLNSLGYRAFLVGERLMSSSDPGVALRRLLGRDESAPMAGAS